MSMAYTVTFQERGRAILIRTFYADSIGEAFDEAIAWHAGLPESSEDDNTPCYIDYDAIQIQPSWVIWKEKERSAA